MVGKRWHCSLDSATNRNCNGHLGRKTRKELEAAEDGGDGDDGMAVAAHGGVAVAHEDAAGAHGDSVVVHEVAVDGDAAAVVAEADKIDPAGS